MQTQTVEYFDDQQKLVGEIVYEGELSNSKAAIIIFPAFEGRSEFAVNYARQLAEQGYIVFVADIYGDGATATTIEGCFKLITPFLQDRQLVRTRALLAYETLLKQTSIDKHKIGAIGFCFGAMCMLELARSGADLHAGVSMHGVLAKSELMTHAVKTKLLILHGYQDPQVPHSALHDFAKEMASVNRNDWAFTYFGDTKHSFTDPKTGSFDKTKEIEMGREYNQAVAKRSFRYAVDFFQEQLNY